MPVGEGAEEAGTAPAASPTPMAEAERVEAEYVEAERVEAR